VGVHLRYKAMALNTDENICNQYSTRLQDMANVKMTEQEHLHEEFVTWTTKLSVSNRTAQWSTATTSTLLSSSMSCQMRHVLDAP